MFTKKKILVLCTSDNMVTQFLLPHIKFMEDAGNTIEIACGKSGYWFNDLVKMGYTVHELPCSRSVFTKKNIKAFLMLEKIVKEKKYDLIYCQQAIGGMRGRLVGRKYKIPVIYTTHGFSFYKGCSLKAKFLYKPAEKYFAKFTDVLVTINDEDFEAAKKIKKDNVFKVSGIGYDPKKYQNQLSHAEARKMLSIKDDEILVCTIAEYIKRKNYKTMLKTMAKLPKNIKFIACGTGVLFDEMKKYVKKLHIEDRVFLAGYRKDVNNVLAASDIFFLPSYSEGLTLSIIEAMNFGLPVVTSDVRGNRDLIENGKGGYVCGANDSDKFAESIMTLANNSELRKQFGEYNKSQCDKYTLEKVLKQLEEVYSHIHFNDKAN